MSGLSGDVDDLGHPNDLCAAHNGASPCSETGSQTGSQTGTETCSCAG